MKFLSQLLGLIILTQPLCASGDPMISEPFSLIKNSSGLSVDMAYVPVGYSAFYDFRLISPYDPNIQKSLVATFNHHGAQLCYVGVGHCYGSSTPVHKMIMKKMDEFKPSVVILEGFNGREESAGMLIERTRAAIEKVKLKSWLESCDEGEYAGYLAAGRGIKIIGGEPQETHVLEKILKLGFTKRDLIYFYMSRYIPQLVREGSVKSLEDLPLKLEPYVNGFLAKQFKLEGDELLVYDAYQSWLRQHYQKDLSLEELGNPMLTYPDPKGVNRLEMISCAVTLIRDQNILTTILKYLHVYKRVLVVYGGGHFFAEEKVLEHYLGKAFLEEFPI